VTVRSATIVRPASRWRRAPTTGARGAADRVRRSHAQTRPTLRLALAFVAAAAVAAAAGSARWLPLHLFLAGGVVLAISGVSLMLTVTWSAAPAPPDAWVALQRGAVALGAAGVAFGHAADAPVGLVAMAGVLYLAGLVVLGVLLVSTVRRGVERRFDVAVASYVAALVCGVAGVGLGIAMVADTAAAGTRAAHLTVNLLGLVGLVVGGTMPFFAATVGRARMSPKATPRRLAVTLAWQVVAVTVAAALLAGERERVAAFALVGYAVGVVATLTTLPRPTRRQLTWSGPRLLALWTGGAWWAIAVAATAADVAADRVVFGGRWLLVLVLAGYAQILWGSLAYLLPMLRGGGHEHLGAGFATTRSWTGLAAANVAGVTAALALPGVATAFAVAVWVLDGAWRAARVGLGRAARPEERP
jgi:nitrite reductase (NO-forming)